MYKRKMIIFISCIFFAATSMLTFADIDRAALKEKGKDKMLRTPERVRDFQWNTVSNLQFPTTNYGIFGMDILKSRGGGYWPRGSQNQYIFGGGIWFAAMKLHTDEGSEYYRKYVEVTYNPNNGKSWMVPGRIQDGDAEDPERLEDYRVYFSTDFRTSDGTPFDEKDGPNWPVWDASQDETDTLKYNRYFGYYIYEPKDEDNSLRNKNTYPKGPAFISGEDIFCTFKDTDLSQYDGGVGRRTNEGYPLKLQFEHTIYSWGFGDYKDFIFLRYDIINYSNDTLFNCYLAPVLDIDLARASRASAGAANDRVDFYDFEEGDDTLNLAFQWTNTNVGEKGYGFGYLGFDFLESPAIKKCENYRIQDSEVPGVKDTICIQCIETKDTIVDVYEDEVIVGQTDSTMCTDTLEFDIKETTFIRKDKRAYPNRDQIGLTTFRNWPIEVDPQEDGERYDFISAGVVDGDEGPGDKRFMMTTGPFHIMPTIDINGEKYRDTVRVVIAIVLANAAEKEEADGTKEDLKELVKRDMFAQRVYDDNFRAPLPPDRADLEVTPLNNASKITWDNTSELSLDIYEKGLDFMGYRLYRSRDLNLDTFDIDEISAGGDYASGKGPMGWRQVAEWEVPTPFQKSVTRSGTDPDYTSNPLFDSLRIVGPVVEADGTVNKFAIRVMRVGQGVNLYPYYVMYNTFNIPYAFPVIASIDTALFSKPWGPYYNSKLNDSDLPLFPYQMNQVSAFKPTSHFLLDSLLVGTIELNSSLLQYNPLLWKKETLTITEDEYLVLEDQVEDTVYFKDSYRMETVDGQSRYLIDRMIPLAKSEYMRDTLHVQQALDSIYYYMQHGLVSKVKFPEMEQRTEVRVNVIGDYIDEITNHRTYYDIGDNNMDGKLEYNEDPAKTEKIINNVSYYYRLLAFDEGDQTQPTPIKLNDGGAGLPNVDEVFPSASKAGDKSTFEIIHEDTDKLGGLYNFRFYAINQDRVNQLFEGDTLELEFQPFWSQNEIQFGEEGVKHSFGLYWRRLILRNISKDQILFNGTTQLEATAGQMSYRGGFTEDGYSYVLADSSVVDPVTGDTNNFGLPTSEAWDQRSGHFTTGDFTKDNYYYTFSMLQPALGTIGFSFDFSIKQFGGRYRPSHSTGVVSSDAVTPVNFITDEDDAERNSDKVMTTQWVYDHVLRQWFDTFYPSPKYGSFNNGPAEYIVTFKEGGTEDIEIFWGGNTETKSKVFKVPYLTYEVENVITYDRNDENGNPVSVGYPGLVEPIVLPETLEATHRSYDGASTINVNIYYPNPRNLMDKTDDFIGRYNATSFAWVGGRGVTSPIQLRNFVGYKSAEYKENGFKSNVGTQNRYYLSASNGEDTVDFVNMMCASGCFFAFDYANKGRRFFVPTIEWDPVEEYQYGQDFKPGDQVKLATTGGALGLPLPGAKVRARVTPNLIPIDNYTDDHMEQVQVVPNPYYLGHQGQRSAYDAKIYFTKLPQQCTIEIYTATGDLVQTIEHDARVAAEENREAIEVWDLLSRNKQRVQSQALIALIKTPNGAEIIRNFSLVVGGFRLIEED